MPYWLAKNLTVRCKRIDVCGRPVRLGVGTGDRLRFVPKQSAAGHRRVGRALLYDGLRRQRTVEQSEGPDPFVWRTEARIRQRRTDLGAVARQVVAAQLEAHVAAGRGIELVVGVPAHLLLKTTHKRHVHRQNL